MRHSSGDVARYSYQSTTVAKLIDKSRSSVTRWFNFELRLLFGDAGFRDRIDEFDLRIAQITSAMQQ